MAEEWRLRAWRLWGTPGESAETKDRSVFIGFGENFGKPRLGQRLLAESENRTGSSSLAAGVCVQISPPGDRAVERQPPGCPPPNSMSTPLFLMKLSRLICT